VLADFSDEAFFEHEEAEVADEWWTMADGAFAHLRFRLGCLHKDKNLAGRKLPMNRRELLKAQLWLRCRDRALDTVFAQARGDAQYHHDRAVPAGGQADLAARPWPLRWRKFSASPSSSTTAPAAPADRSATRRRRVLSLNGYTLLMTLSSLAVLPEADRLFDRPVAYEVSQFAPVARVLADPTLLAVPGVGAVEDAAGIRRRRKKTTRRNSLRLVGSLRHAACGDGDVCGQRRHQIGCTFRFAAPVPR